MKTLNEFKKVIALGLSLSLMSTVLLGATALSLADYPKPFVIDGLPASNLAVVVGDNAAASDVVGMGDIISGLQASSIKKKEVPQFTPDVQIDEEGTTVGTTGNLLEVNESLGSVKELFSESDLDILKGGTVTTTKGVTKYNQYLKFNASSAINSTKVIFTEDNFLDLADFFYIASGDDVFEWELHFEDGLTSEVSSTNSSIASLFDFNQKEIDILGQKYTIVNTELDNTQDAESAGHDLKIELIGGGINGRLTGGQEETYFVGDKEYKVKVVILSRDGTILNVNGKDLAPMKIGQMEVLDDGLLIGIRNIIEDSFNIAEFTLGGNKLSFFDIDVIDDHYTSTGVGVNGELIDNGQVRIKGNLNAKRSEFTLSNIMYRLKAEPTSGHGIFIPPGHGLREFLTEPDGLLSPGWDIKYEGLTDTGTTFVKLRSSGSKDEYKLEFTTEEGLNYVVPAFTMKNATVRPGEGDGGVYHNMLWTVESPNERWYQIKEKDYFVISNLEIGQTRPGTGLTGATTDNDLPEHFGCAIPVRTATRSLGSNTRVMRYLSSNTSSETNFLTFQDLATGIKKVAVNWTMGNVVASPNFTIVAGGNQFIGRLDAGADTSPASRNITVDLDGNGTIGRGAIGTAAGPLLGNAWIVTQGGAILFINTSSNFSTTGVTEIPRVGMGTDGGYSGGAGARAGASGESTSGATTFGNSSCLTLTIINNKFDQHQPSPSRTDNLNFSIGVIGREVGGRNKIGISMEEYEQTAQHNWGFENMTYFNLTSNPTIKRQLDTYGGLWEFNDPLNNETEEFTYEFPLSQRGPRITIGGQGINVGLNEELEPQIIFSEELNKLPVGLSKLASEIKNIKQYNTIIVGGPCANKWAAELMNNPEPCHESVPQGEALIKFYEHSNGNVALLIAGRDALDTRRGARALQTEKIKEAGEVKAARVSGISLTDIVVRPIK
ncbi:hypothetical protein HZA97_05085 [Candidatus Woesearchaeota archaeon]|nr:hypothetical protein [Candidatus Woesearchaeota archaeon]